VGAAVVGAALLTLAAAGTASAYPGPEHRMFTADRVHRFLTGFYGQHGPSAAQRAHDVAPRLRRAAAAQHRYDLLLCSRGTPRSVTVGRIVPASAGRARATVTTTAADHHRSSFTVYVSRDASRPMRVTDVVCGTVR
jgi:hypothetical protein